MIDITFTCREWWWQKVHKGDGVAIAVVEKYEWENTTPSRVIPAVLCIYEIGGPPLAKWVLLWERIK